MPKEKRSARSGKRGRGSGRGRERNDASTGGNDLSQGDAKVQYMYIRTAKTTFASQNDRSRVSNF